VRSSLGPDLRPGRASHRPRDGLGSQEMSERILLVEDDPALLTILQAAMSYGGFQSECVVSGVEAIEKFGSGAFDAVLVDLGLPDLDGAEVLRRLRETSDVPLLVVSARGAEGDKIEALDLGADDFITKPFLPGELLARIRAALRRHHLGREREERGEADPARDPLSVGPLTLDPFDRSVALHGNKVLLSHAEYKIMSALVSCRDGVASKAQLLKSLYDSEALDETRIVEVYISNIRRKLRSLDEREFIFNFRGRGWKLVIPQD